MKLNFGFWKLVQVALMYRSRLPFPGWASAPLHWTELLMWGSALWNQSSPLFPQSFPNKTGWRRSRFSVAFQCRWHFNGSTAPLALKSSCKQVFSRAILQAFVGSALRRKLLGSCRALSGWVRKGWKIPVLRTGMKEEMEKLLTWRNSLFPENTREEMLQSERQISSF